MFVSTFDLVAVGSLSGRDYVDVDVEWEQGVVIGDELKIGEACLFFGFA